ncbi:hypothetical protein DM02DRAFT_673277 [Periconia macrospinosa]|uniref:Uncharacterized protein n=1 Tax=Periconia macrospinosa TaxID=97972 RepID=A0A2V1DN54_9PLEO|nr:hypothetical protein DM02DRAFT_673277 [Periconia macrospinosa]
MPTPPPCPVSNIDRALSSYVHSREETLKIRATLTSYLTASLRPVNSPSQNHHLNQECPQDITAASKNPPGVAGLRREYLEVIKAQSAAQSRYRQLQSSLDDLRHGHSTASHPESNRKHDDDTMQVYIELLRQRRGVSELHIIQDSLEKLLNANPINGLQEPKALVADAIGEQPNLPAERLEKLSRPGDENSLTLKVKKEVISASSAMERAKSARSKAKNTSRDAPKLQEQVYALGRAREEMIDWVQIELAKIEEQSVIEDVSPIKRATQPMSSIDLASSESQIRKTYESYTASRQAAIKSHLSLQEISDAGQAIETPQTKAQQIDADQCNEHLLDVFAKVLPHLPNLMHIDSVERDLVQQMVYLQAQIHAADEETTEHLLRLAGESHMLPSGSKAVETWGTVTVEMEGANEGFVKARIADSRQEISRVSTIVDLCSLQSQVLSSM